VVSLVPLPIDSELDRIVALARQKNVVLVAEPGAGKTTRVPRGLLLGGGFEREIVVLEPRRLATRMSAKRVAEELGEPLGERVGYTVRFEDVSSARTKLRFVTEGVLSRRLVSDPQLTGVSCVVLDELHERSIHTDLALAILRSLQSERRPDLRIVAMSATLDAERVAAFLDAEVVTVGGRMFDVAISYEESGDDRSLERKVAAAVKRALRDEPEGDVLVFLPGAGEIRRCKDALGAIDAEVLPLHGDLPPAEQDRAIARALRRKVILSTNVAETSLTIDGVTAVIDSGLARVARHSPFSGLPSLVMAPISRASARQRSGRAGRTRPGIAIRLYTKSDHDARPAHDEPELRRSDLSETALSLHARGVRDLASFPFFEAPSASALSSADEQLRALGAIDLEGQVTPVGRQMLELPLAPRLSRLLVAAHNEGAGPAGALMAALLSERDLRTSLRTRFDGGTSGVHESGSSDALHRLELFEQVERGGSLNASKLRDHGLDVGGGMRVARTRDQLTRALRKLPRPEREYATDEEEALGKAILLAFPDRVGKRRRKGEPEIVLSAGGAARLSDASVVREPDLMVAMEAEEVRGSVQVRTASAIEPEWLLELFPDAIEDVSELRYDSGKGRLEKVSGLRYGALLIDESRSDAAGDPRAAERLAQAAFDSGIDRFIPRDERAQLRLRLAAARRVDPSLPVLDDALVREVVREACEGKRSLSELANENVWELLVARLAPFTSQLERLAPAFVELPGRKRSAVHYEEDRPPWVESRMQDFFGWKEGPKIGGEPLVLHFLAPNQRAVQVTTDLAGFWVRHYPALRKELMRKYPRHYWPEDPTTAEPPPPRPPRRGS
jgi:ATP-dependent helicase HrpB